MEPLRGDAAGVAARRKARARPLARVSLPAYTGGCVLGRGRSGVVYLGRDQHGREVASKVFHARGPVRLLQWVLLGAPNPYLWCEDAVRCAFLRRRVLEQLVPAWSGGRLTVATARGYGWNDEARAFQLDADRVAGRPPLLHHPLRMDVGEARRLRRDVLVPLQERLLAAGFEGLVWQAGRGNPCALNNFLLRTPDPGAPVDPAGERWSWIDLESGVPAILSPHPRGLLFYLRRAVRLRRWLFDDVDTGRLRSYLAGESCLSRGRLGDERRTRLLADVEELALAQRRWKGLRRHQRAIGYRVATGELDPDLAERYRRRPVRWHGAEAVRALRHLPHRGALVLGSCLAPLVRLQLQRLPARATRFLLSHRHRETLARRYVRGRIRSWRERGQMDAGDAALLRERIRVEESAVYLTDFGVHLALKPFVKAVEWWMFPALYAVGWIGETTLAAALLLGGALARTVYTCGRLVQCSLRRHERPWVALGTGILPVLGNLAFPLQLLYSSTAERDELARFLLHDGGARLGERLPLWGGRDTSTEHFFNRLPERLFGSRTRAGKPAPGSPSTRG